MSPAPGAGLVALVLGLAGCEAPLELTATTGPSGVEVHASRPVAEVELVDATGAPVERRVLPTPGDTVVLGVDAPAGRYTVRSGDAMVDVDVPAREPVRAEVQVAPGAPWVPLRGEIEVPGVHEVTLGLVAGPGQPASVPTSVGDVVLPAPGLRVTRTVPVDGAGVDLVAGNAHATLVPVPVDATDLSIVSVVFPALDDGTPDVARAPDVIPVPTPLWDRLVRWVGSGARRHDAEAPFGWTAVTLRNAGDRPIDVSVAQDIPDPAFRPRLRSTDGGTDRVTGLVRVPAHGQSVATLPVFVDVERAADGPVVATVELRPLGGGEVTRVEHTLYVRHGDPGATAGFFVSTAAALAGLAWFARRVGGWLTASPTTELFTIALFASASFVTTGVGDLLTMALGAALGPFAPLVTGLFSEVGRAALQGTLLALRPKPGTLALTLVTSYLLRMLALGSVTAGDVVYVGATLAAQELLARLVGLHRGHPPGFAALAVVLGGASVVTTLVGMWLGIVLYRLYYADWYILLQVLVPGVLYHVIAARVATGLGDQLLRVRS